MVFVSLTIFISVILFQAGLINSYRINLEELTIVDQIVYFAVLFCVSVALCVGSLIRVDDNNPQHASVIPRRVNRVSTILLMVSTFAVLALVIELIGKYGFQEFLYGSLRGYMKDDSTFEERPYLAFSIFPLMTGPLCTINKEQDPHYYLHMTWGFIIMLLFSLMYSSRIMVLEYVLFSVVVWLRISSFNNPISIKMILLSLTLVISMLIATSAVRDYESVGRRYTDSAVNWGISRLIDYPLSSYEYSVFLLNVGGIKNAVLSDLIPSVGRFTGELSSDAFSSSNELLSYFKSKDVGSGEYTNRGAIGDLFQYRPSSIGILLLTLYVILCIVSWRAFKKGSVIGCLTYPIFLYSIIEFWRYGVFLTEIPQLLMVLSFITSAYVSENKLPFDRLKLPLLSRR